MPALLAIETSNPSAGADGASAGVALLEIEPSGAPGRTLAVELLGPADRHDDGLMAAIDRACRAARIGPGDLARVAVSIGPGGYTALRIAVATAKMLCESTGAACIGVPSALVVARRVRASPPFGVALASKGESTYLTVFGRDAATPASRGTIVTATGLAPLRLAALVADRFLPDLMRAECARLGVPIEPPVLVPVACAHASLALPPIDPALLLPIYPREADAVTLWRQRHPHAPNPGVDST